MGLAPDTAPQDVLLAVLDLLKGELAPKVAAATMSQTMPDFTPDPTKFVPVAALAGLLHDRNTRLATMAERDATAWVQDAMRRGFITPAMKEWATALCTQDPESFDAFLTKSVPSYAHLSTQMTHMRAAPERQTPAAEGAVADAICQQPGLPLGGLKA